jgi:hypothetical protein
LTAIETLRVARVCRVQVTVDGADLKLRAPSPPPPDVLARPKRDKAEIIRLLCPARRIWSARDWLAFFEERAAVAEFDGGLTRSDAEAQAFEACVVEYINRNLMTSPPGYCSACGGSKNNHDAILPFGPGPRGHCWLHSDCWFFWQAAQRREALAFLGGIGIGAGEPPR